MAGKRKVLITGGAGFVGSQLGHRLDKAGYDVILLDNMAFGHLDNLIIDGKTFGRLVVKDIRAPLPQLTKLLEGVETVFHLAGVAALPECQADPQLAYDVNVSGTGNILEACRLTGVKRVIFASTSATYENTKSELFKESDPVSPTLIYSMTKAAAENLCTAYSTNYGLDIITVRFFNIYGPHQDFKRTSPPFTSYLAATLSKGVAPTMFNKDPNALRDYVFSEDLIALLIAMHEKRDRHYAAEVFNACSGKGYSAPKIFDIMRNHAGLPDIEGQYKGPSLFWEKYASLSAEPYPLDPKRITKEVYKQSIGDNTKTCHEFGWVPKVDMVDGLKQVFQYALDHSDKIVLAPTNGVSNPRDSFQAKNGVNGQHQEPVKVAA